MATVVGADSGAGAGSSITSAGASPSGADTAVLIAATSIAGYAAEFKYNDDSGAAIDSVGTPVDQNLFGSWHAYSNYWGEAGSPTGALDLYGEWASSTLSGAFTAVHVSGADQTTPYVTVNAVGANRADASYDFEVTGSDLEPDQLCIAQLTLLAAACNFVSLTPDGGTTIPSASVATGPTEENQEVTVASLHGQADGSGNVSLGATVTLSSANPSAWRLRLVAVNDAVGGSFNAASADSATLGESSGSALSASAALTEAAAASESSAATGAFSAADASAVTAAETSACAAAFQAAGAEAATAGESSAGTTTGDYSAATAESVTLTEASAHSLSASAAASEPITAAEATAATSAATAAATETAAAGEASGAVLGADGDYFAAVSEIVVFDAAAAAALAAAAAGTAGVTLSEVSAAVLAGMVLAASPIVGRNQADSRSPRVQASARTTRNQTRAR